MLGPSHEKVIMCRTDVIMARKAEDLSELNACTHLIISIGHIGKQYFDNYLYQDSE